MIPKADLVFDFSSSARGGSLRRLNAYVDYFSGHPLATHFYINDAVAHKHEIAAKVSTSFVAKSGLAKLTLGAEHLAGPDTRSRWADRPAWGFSYGIPVRAGFAKQHWLHLSNVLPFSYGQCSLSWRLRMKSIAQLQQYRYCAGNIDVMSGESNFTLERASAALGWSGQTVLLRNGYTPFTTAPAAGASMPEQRYALAVGTEDYKRMDLTYEVYRALKDELRLATLVIIGLASGIPGNVRQAHDVVCETGLSHDALVSRYRRASYFISTSEVENSSLAVLEGLTLTGNAILSDIPSHREMLQHEPGGVVIGGKPYLRIDATAPNAAVLPDWGVEIDRMLHVMGLNRAKVQ
jgi:glycosyltransferase involved in cell wall biosynthesis